MPTFTKRILFCDLLKRRSEEVDAIIDTGPDNCVIPESLVQRLGIAPMGIADHKTADGRIVEVPITGPRGEIEGSFAFTNTAILPDPAERSSRLTPLAALGYGVEPTGKLIPRVQRLLTLTNWRTI